MKCTIPNEHNVICRADDNIDFQKMCNIHLVDKNNVKKFWQILLGYGLLFHMQFSDLLAT